MIFDEICKTIDFVLDEVDGDYEYTKGNFHLGEILDKKTVSFPELMNMYEDDSKDATILFYEDRDGGLCAEINFYLYGDWFAGMYLRGDGFTEYLSKYCGAK